MLRESDAVNWHSARSTSVFSGKVWSQEITLGKGYLVALLFNIVLFWVIRMLAVKYWPGWIAQHADHHQQIFFFGTQAIAWATHFSTILFFDAIDYFKLFYKYKVNKDNLIWDVDPEGWKKLRGRALYFNFLAIIVIGPALLFFDSFFTKIRF